jgi:hypothetical protein
MRLGENGAVLVIAQPDVVSRTTLLHGACQRPFCLPTAKPNVRIFSIQKEIV